MVEIWLHVVRGSILWGWEFDCLCLALWGVQVLLPDQISNWYGAGTLIIMIMKRVPIRQRITYIKLIHILYLMRAFAKWLSSQLLLDRLKWFMLAFWASFIHFFQYNWFPLVSQQLVIKNQRYYVFCLFVILIWCLIINLYICMLLWNSIFLSSTDHLHLTSVILFYVQLFYLQKYCLFVPSIVIRKYLPC